MTSRNLFFKRLGEDICRRKHEWILSGIVFVLFVVVIPLQMLLSNLYSGDYVALAESQYVEDVMECMFSKGNPVLYCIAIVASWICGFNGMSYLFSKSKTDLYHSIPVSRKQLFLVSYTNSILEYAVPYLIALCIGGLAVFALSGGSVSVWGAAFVAYGYHLLGYCMLLNINLVIVMLSGRLLVAVLGMVATYGYGIAWYVILDVYKDTFFYCLVDEFHAAVVQMLSPICNYLLSGGLAEEVGMESLVGLMAVIAIGCFVAAFVLYQKRPSCASGGTIAFAGTKPFIKGAVMLPLALLGGVIMYTIYHRMAFWIFGAVFVIFVSHIALQGILEQADIRAIGRGLKTVAIVSVLALVIFSTFYFDIFGCNGYMPDADDVESCAVVMKEEPESEYEDVSHDLDTAEKRAERMRITDVEQVYALSEAGYETRKRLYGQGATFEREDTNTCNFYVYYNLKNGKTVKRLYTIDDNVEENAGKLKSILDNPEYKLGSWIFSASDNYTIDICGYDKNGEWHTVSVGDAEGKQVIMDALRVDIMNSSVDAMENQPGIGYIDFSVYEGTGYDKMNIVVATEYISESYENTKAIMDKYGFLTENIEGISLPEAEQVEQLAIFQDGVLIGMTTEKRDISAVMPYLKSDDTYYATPLRGTIFEYKGGGESKIKLHLYTSDSSYNALLDVNTPETIKKRLGVSR